jgi:hypothetical protein
VALEKQACPACPISYPKKEIFYSPAPVALVISPYKEVIPLEKVNSEKAFLEPPKSLFFVQETKNLPPFEKKISLETQERIVSPVEITTVSNTKNSKINLHAKSEFFSPPPREEGFLSPQFHFSLPSLSDLNTLSLSEDFDVEVTWTPDKEKGYVFAATLIPKEGKKFPRLHQNFFFVLDRSNSIQKKRLSSTRYALWTAIKCLKKEDTFNLFAFDSSVDILFTCNQPKEEKYLQRAKKFLVTQDLGSFFSSSHMHRPLDKIIDASKTLSDNEIGTIIVLSDGDSVGKSKNWHWMQTWTEKNQGRLNLFFVGIESDRYGKLLDFFATINKGKRWEASTDRGLKKQLVKLMKSVRNPIANNMQATFLFPSGEGKVSFLPPETQLRNLYGQEPYVILGSTKTLDDSLLFLQGKIGNKWINIKKKIHFSPEKEGGRALAEQWAVRSSYEYYKLFLKDPNPEYVKKANRLLQPYEITGLFP